MAREECGMAMPRGFIPADGQPGHATWLWVCALKPYHGSMQHGEHARRAKSREVFSVFDDQLWSVGIPR